jgi:hypothetical protein
MVGSEINKLQKLLGNFLSMSIHVLRLHFLNTLLSHTFNIHSFITDQVLHPHKTTSNIAMLYIYMFVLTTGMSIFRTVNTAGRGCNSNGGVKECI